MNGDRIVADVTQLLNEVIRQFGAAVAAGRFDAAEKFAVIAIHLKQQEVVA